MLPTLCLKKNVTWFKPRNVNNSLEWHLKNCIFPKIKIHLGQPTIELFAFRESRKVKTFYSFHNNPMTSGVDE